jgi:hypothetical protein
MLLPLLAQPCVDRDIGRPRTRPDAVRGDKAYSSRAIRGHLRERGIKSVIPEPDDHKKPPQNDAAHAADAPSQSTRTTVGTATSSSAASASSSTGQDSLPATTNTPLAIAQRSYSTPSSPGPAN